MFCTNCGKKLNKNDHFCKYCGKMITLKEKNVVHPNNIHKDVQENVKPDFEKIYLNTNKENFCKNKINICAFLFGPYYLLYRKMYLYGIIWLLLNFFVGIFTSDWISFLFHVVLAFYFALEFNFLYQKKMEDDLKQVNKLDKNNQIDFCKRKGGTTILPIIIVLIISFFLHSLIETYKSYEIINNDNPYGYEEYYR